MNLPEFPARRRIGMPWGGWLNLHEQPGAGPPLLLLHGFTDCAESFRLILPALARRHVLMPDLRGHGGSAHAPIGGLDDLAEDLEALAHAIGLPEAIVVGHSMGALAALALAARGRVAVQEIVLISGSLRPRSAAFIEMRNGFEGLSVPVPPDHPFWDMWYACGCPVSETFIAPLRAGCLRMRREDWLACLDILERADLRSVAAGLKVPVHIISGEEDRIFPQDHQAALATAVRAETWLELPGVGHNPHWEVPERIGVFLNAIGTRAQTRRVGAGI